MLLLVDLLGVAVSLVAQVGTWQVFRRVGAVFTVHGGIARGSVGRGRLLALSLSDVEELYVTRFVGEFEVAP